MPQSFQKHDSKNEMPLAGNFFSGENQLRKNAISGAILAGGNIGLLLLSYPVYLAYLGPEWYGVWATLSVVVAVGQMGNLGIHHAVARHVANALGRQEPQEATKLIGAALTLVMIPCLLLMVSSFSFPGEISSLLGFEKPFFETTERLLPLIGILSALVLIVEVLKGVLIGMNKMDVGNYFFLGGRCVQFGLSVAFIASGKGIIGLFYGSASGYLLIAIFYTISVSRHLAISNLQDLRFSLRHVKSLAAFGSYMSASSLVSIFMDPFNKVMLSRYVSLETVTAYEIGIKGVQAIRALFEGALKAIMPEISNLTGKGENFMSDVKQIHKKAVQIVAWTAIPMFVAIFAMASPFLKLWFGAKFFPDMSIALRWFTVGYLVNLISVPAFYVLLGLNRAKYCFYAALLRSSMHFLLVMFILLIGFDLSLNLIVGIHTFSMMGSALLVIFMYISATALPKIRQTV